ncbi:proline hydroxylase [Pseudoalteromonas luteoviolacea]|uniref:Proline hydroxylase n=1 Tax=Pseudoalteromonas luteoviolacea TaxID=43657 RepID=A0A0C1QS42_9GAMM|nr:2OG-Fe(II) oxygenase [Pseudoalteromonas luteoviolacea]KID57842.1 proline hydroxylase [Pseudoalteromonas luteoviolacea]
MTDFIRVYDNALSAEFCNKFMQTFDESPHLAQGQTSGGVDLSKKVSQDLYLNNHPEYQSQLREIEQATSKYLFEYIEEHFFMMLGAFGLNVYHPQTGQPVNLTMDNFEEIGKPQLPILTQQLFRLGPIQAQKYPVNKGGYPYWHSEVYPQLHHNEALHRVLLFMFYLNDVEDGGETEFFYQNKKLTPKQGSMVIAPSYFTHTHRGNMPLSNDKYILTSWVLFQRAERLYGAPPQNATA